MPDPLDYLDPVAAAAYRRAMMARQAQLDPAADSPIGQMPEEEQRSLLGRMLDTSLGGLTYLGKVLDKTFGGRAIRGVLGGQAGEIASVLPFSDTLGLTDEKNVVQGTDLLNRLGLTTRGDDSWQNQLAGFGAEVLTDPSTYVGIGPLTQAGKQAAMKGAKLAPTLAGRINAGEAGLMSFGLPLGKSLFGIEPAILGTGKAAADFAEAAPRFAAYPFQKAGELAEAGPGRVAEKVIGFNPVTEAGNLAGDAYRWGRSQFDTRVLGAGTRAGQEVAEGTIHPEYQRLLQQGRDRFADAAVDLERIGKPGTPERTAAEQYLITKVETPTDWNKNLTERFQRMKDEGLDPAVIQTNMDDLKAINDEAQKWAAANGPTAAKWSSVLTPEQIQQLGRHADEAGQLFTNLRGSAKALGIQSPDNIDLLEYLTRQKATLPQQAGESVWSYAKRATGDFNARNEFQARRLEEFHDLPGGTLQLNDLIKDPRFSGPDRTMANTQAAADELVRIMTGKNPNQVGELVTQKAKALANTLHKMEPYYAEQGKDFFRLDFAGNRLSRETAQARNVSAAEGAYTAVEHYAKPVASFKPGEGVPVGEVFDRLGLTAAPNGVRTSWQIAASKLGLGKIDDLQHFALPADLAADLVQMGKAWVNPKEMKPLLHAWDMMSNLFKAGVTTVFPAFHVRNAFSGLFNTWRDNAFSLRSMRESTDLLRGAHLSEETAAKLFPGMTRGQATEQFMKELVANRVSFGRNVRTFDLADEGLRLPAAGGQPQSARQITGDFFGGLGPTDRKWETIRREYLSPGMIAGVSADEDVNKFVKAGRAVGSAIEDSIRTGHYLEKRLQGFSPGTAAESVMKYHIDYGNLTQAEKNLYRRIYPWYNFTSRNLPPILSDLATNPGKITGATRLVSGVRDPDQFAPSYIAEGAAIPVGHGENGFQRYISSFGLPIEDEGVKLLGSVLKGDVGRSFQIGIGAANPLIKAPFEQAFGTQLFSGRKLEDLRPSTLASLGGILPDSVARGFDQVVANSPASRIFHTGETFLDPRKDVLATLLNVGTGVKVTDVDTAKQTNIAARELAKNLLRPSTEARVREEVYVPKEKIQELDATERFLVDLIRNTNARIIQQQAEEKRLLQGQR